MIWEGTLQLQDSWFPSGNTKAAFTFPEFLFVPFSADIPARKWWYISADDLWAPALMWGSQKLIQGEAAILGVGIGWPMLQQNSLHKALCPGAWITAPSPLLEEVNFHFFPYLGWRERKIKKKCSLYWLNFIIIINFSMCLKVPNGNTKMK